MLKIRASNQDETKKESEFEQSRASVIKQGRSIYFFDQVHQASVLEAVRHLTQLQIESAKKPITIVINSAGGSCYDGLALYDCIRCCQAPVTTIGLGLVASMGFIIFLAGDKRVASPNTRFLNHQVSSEIAGKASDIEIERDEIAALEAVTIKIVSERTGIPESKIKKDVKAGDNYYSAKEAVKQGIAHEIFQYIDKNEIKTAPVITTKEQ